MGTTKSYYDELCDYIIDMHDTVTHVLFEQVNDTYIAIKPFVPEDIYNLIYNIHTNVMHDYNVNFDVLDAAIEREDTAVMYEKCCFLREFMKYNIQTDIALVKLLKEAYV